MIAQFKPAPHLATLAATVLVCALGCFTLASAADKNAGSVPVGPGAVAQKSPGGHAADQRKTTRERIIQILEKELAIYDSQVVEQQKKLDDLTARLNTSPLQTGNRPNIAPSSEPEVSTKLQTLLLEAQSEYAHSVALYGLLTNMSRAELKRSLYTISPDPQLSKLLENLSTNEQKLAEQLELYSSEHPEVHRFQAIVKKIYAQIDDRIDGILEGLKAQMVAKKAKVDYLQATLDKARDGEVKTVGDRRQYFQAKRDLENLQLIIEKLRMRLVQEKIDAAIAQP